MLNLLKFVATVLLLWGNCSEAVSDDFSDSFRFADGQPVVDVGRAAKVEAYEELLNEFPDDPRRAKVMLALSSLWENTIPSHGVVPDYKKSVAWLRKAVSVAAKGSDDWVTAQFYLASRVSDDAPGEARAILKEIGKFATDNVTAIKVLYEQQMMEVNSGELENAEEICFKIQRWTKDDSRMPEDTWSIGQVFSIQQNSATSMMNSWLYSNEPHEERLKKFEKILDVRNTEFNDNLLEEMRVRLSEMKDQSDVLALAPPASVETNRKHFYRRIVMIVTVMILFLGLWRANAAK